MSKPDHAKEIRFALNNPRELCERLGFLTDRASFTKQANGIVMRCQVHADRSPSCSVQQRNGIVLWRCHACGESGDALDLVAIANGLSTKRDFPRVLLEAASLAGLHDIVHELSTGKELPDRQRVTSVPSEPEPDREWPPLDGVRQLWSILLPVTDDVCVSDWLRNRAIDPAAVGGRELAGALPEDSPNPEWVGGLRTWAEMGYRLIFPMFDPGGQMRSVRVGRIRDGEGPKRKGPFGYKASGLVLADTMGRAMLQGRTTERVVVTEGETDFLTWATRTTDAGTANIGVISGSWNREFASMFTKGCRVVIRTDNDKAGNRYANEIASSLRGRCFVRRAE